MRFVQYSTHPHVMVPKHASETTKSDPPSLRAFAMAVVDVDDAMVVVESADADRCWIAKRADTVIVVHKRRREEVIDESIIVLFYYG